MDHLSLETLAELLEGAPTQGQARHLRECAVCRGELAALREQTEALGSLPDVRPPHGEWEGIEARLVEEGLLTRPASAPGRAASVRTQSASPLPASEVAPPLVTPRAGSRRASAPAHGRTDWSRTAAGVALLVAGAAMGVGASVAGGWPAGETSAQTGSERASAATAPAQDIARLATLDFDEATRDMTLDEAAELVRVTEEWYLASLVGYHERLRMEGSAPPADPVGRFAAIEALMAAGRAAVREDPTDPFLNGLLVNVHAEREMALRGLQARSISDNWY